MPSELLIPESTTRPPRMISLRPPNNGEPVTRIQAVTHALPDRTVVRPVSEAARVDPRTYQIGQLKRRYHPSETTLADGTTSLVFKLTPSDPDFPFDLAHLHCDLRIPAEYPEIAPALHVLNKNIPRGFAINIERGWDRLVQERPDSTLLSRTNALDRKLEGLLSEKKTETIKIVQFKDTRHEEEDPRQVGQAQVITPAPDTSSTEQKARRPVQREPSYTSSQIAEARTRRTRETRQLESRMGSLPLFQKSVDGVVYTVPFEPSKKDGLPDYLQSMKTVQVIVPLLYPLQRLRVLLGTAGAEESEAMEELISDKAATLKNMTLMSYLNYLTQNLHVFAKMVLLHRAKVLARSRDSSRQASEDGERSREKGKEVVSDMVDDRPHLRLAPRPLDWTVDSDSNDSDTSSSYDEADFHDSSDEHPDGVSHSHALHPAPLYDDSERGTSISFPNLELREIGTFRISLLSINTKCERCKTINEVADLRPHVEETGHCRKCSSTFAVKFRPLLMHQASSRAGMVDVVGCKVAEMLPSTFIPECASCLTESPGLVAVQGDAMTNVCVKCHARFTFKIPEVKFLVLTTNSLAAPAETVPRRKTEKLGLQPGEPLPGRGVCAHYRKSFRWFRFSCCGRVYPCDKCHDAEQRHVNEWASRMLCGFCSREQVYSPEACRYCGRSVIGKRGHGFWEGGKGTRDRRLMNRKDRRKYQRVGGGSTVKEKEK